MIKQLSRFIDRFRGGNKLTQWGCGRWAVIYSDGSRSCSMHYGTAKDYAAIFGGQVIHTYDINRKEILR